MMRSIVSLVFVSVICGPLAAAEKPATDEVPQVLQNYVARPDAAFAWTEHNVQRLDSGTVYDLELVSQRWQDITWKHVLQVYEPKNVEFPRHVLLFITGGRNGRKPDRDDMATGLKLAQMTGARCAFLFQVPNQPLLGGRVEDDLISETFLKYLDTGDETWPLLFPMAKSAVRAMDAIQQLAKSQWQQPVEKFIVTGGSKRGWTTWLTAVVDKRVVGIAPIVIDVLNFRPQMKHQKEVWGRYSEQIKDYTSKGLVRVMQEQPEVPLWRWVDPYTYRKQLTLPKLLINGTNDPYWVVDALNLYWDDLDGRKHILYVPNAGHGLDGGREYALTTLAVFFRHTAADQPLPNLRWKHSNADGAFRLTVSSEPKPKAVRLWVAHSDDPDFRDEKWESTPMQSMSDAFVSQVNKPASGHVAFYGEAVYQFGDLEYSLCTQIRRE